MAGSAGWFDPRVSGLFGVAVSFVEGDLGMWPGHASARETRQIDEMIGLKSILAGDCRSLGVRD